MSKRHKERTIELSPEVLKRVKHVYQSWDEHLQKHADRNGTPTPPAIREAKVDKPLSVPEVSLQAEIARYIIREGEHFDEIWEQLLSMIETSPFLQHGYRNLQNPNLAWLFQVGGRGRGIDRVLSGTYEVHNNSGAYFAPDEGV